MGVDLHQRTIVSGMRVYSFCLLIYGCLYNDRSLYDSLWAVFTSERVKFRVTQRAKAVSKVDWDNYIEDGGLAEIHLIVSGLRNRDLETHIRAHPEELEEEDALGYGPLWYASIFGKLADIRTLLKYGAIFNEDTFQFSEFVSRFGSKAIDLMNEHLTPGVLKSLLRNGCGRDWFLDVHTPQFDVNELLAVDEFLLEHGFDINHEDYEGKTLLMAMQR